MANTKTLNSKTKILQPTSRDVGTPNANSADYMTVKRELLLGQTSQVRVRFNEALGVIEASTDGLTWLPMNLDIRAMLGNNYANDAKDVFISQLQSLQGRDGMIYDLYVSKDNLDSTVETSSNSLAEVNGEMREAPFMEPVQDWFQRDRADDAYPIKGGIVQAAYKPYYGEMVDSWKVATFSVNARNLAWDSTRNVWWFIDYSTKTITQVDQDFKKTLGWWTVGSGGAVTLSNPQGVYVDGNYLYVSDYGYSTNGRITRHTINSTGTLLGGLPSGSIVSDSVALLGDGTNYKNLVGITSDSTHLYVICVGTNKIGKSLKSSWDTTPAWDSNFSILSYGTSGGFSGIASDGTDLFITNGTDGKITKIKKDGTVGYQKFSVTTSVYGLAFKNGDLYLYEYSGVTVQKLAIKNTRVLEGQVIGLTPSSTSAIYDIVYVANLLGAGSHGYLSVTGADLKVQVWNASFVEQTSGTPRTTTLTDTSGSGSTTWNGIDCDGTTVVISGNGSTTDAIFTFPVSSLTGTSFNPTRKYNFANNTSNPIGVAFLPSDSTKCLVSRASDVTISLVDLVGASISACFELPYIYGGAGETWAFLKFKNSRELYLRANTYNIPTVVVDWPMSRYMGDGNQPYIIKMLSNNTSYCRGVTFNGNKDMVSARIDTPYGWYTLASDSASDHEVTGKGQRNVRYYGGNYPQTTYHKSYPASTYYAGLVKKVIRYRRKYAASVYSSTNNVLPLDGLYILSDYGLGIIDLETNTEFMTFNRAETSTNYNIIDASTGTSSFTDMYVVDDKVFISSTSSTPVGNLYQIDFINDTAYFAGAATLWKYQLTLKDRNLSSSTFATIYGSAQVSSSVGIGTCTSVISVHAKQDTLIKPEEHNGSITSVDSGEIYVAYGTSAGCGIIKWKAGVSFWCNNSSNYKTKITDSWHMVRALTGGSGAIVVFGDIRKVYANASTATWDIQTGYVSQSYSTASTPALATNYISDIDTKTIYRNGVAYNYIAVAMGPDGAGTQALQVIDVTNNRIETLLSSTGNYQRGCICFGRDGRIYALAAYSSDGTPYFYIYTRKDFYDSVGSGSNWTQEYFTHTSSEYYQLQDHIRNITYSHNTICIANDKGAQIIELPRKDSLVRSISQASRPLTPTKAFLIKNDYVKPALQGAGTKERIRNIFSYAGDTNKFTYASNGGNAWTVSYKNAACFGGDISYVLGSASGESVSWTCVAGTTEIIIYTQRQENQGIMNIKVHDGTSNVKDFNYDSYSKEPVWQDQIVIKGLDSSKTHTVTVKGTGTCNALAISTFYTIFFAGCVEISETSNEYSTGSIVYEVSFDGGTTWQDISDSDQFDMATINHTPNGTVKTRTTFDVNDSEELYVNDQAIIFME